MSLTLTQEQTVSSVLHFMLNETDHHDSFISNSVLAILNVIDADIVTQSGTVYSQPSGPGILDNLAGTAAADGAPGN